MEQNGILRLAKPIRKGFLRLVFSRAVLILLLIVLQVVLFLTFYHWLTELAPVLVSLQGVFTLFMVIYLFNSDMDSTAKLTWMFLIALVPVAGAVLLLFTRTNLGSRRVRAMVDREIDATRNALPQDEEALRAVADGSGTDALVRYLNRSGCFPVCAHTETQYFPTGEDAFSAMLAELEKAKQFIFLEFFIIEEGFMWGSMLDILARKAREGVDVRVMYDGMCEINTLPANYTRLLREQGIRARAFSPITPLVSSHYNYRDHRKILVVDGRTAFTGGVNLADEYINRRERFGHWKDAALLMRGDAARVFTLLFLQMWNTHETDPVYAPYLTQREPTPAPDGFVIPYADCPLDYEKVGETVYMDILSRAERYVHIMTPYLILDGEVETALRYAAQRGVDVKLILPGIPDKKLAYALAKSHYASLLEAGVRIFEYTPGFIHSKVFVSDDLKAVVGTINLDYRSLYHHFECAAYLYRVSAIPDVERDFQDTLARCREVTRESLRQEKFFYKVAGPLIKFLAPLM